MREKYVTETKESIVDKIERAKKIIKEESSKLYKKKNIKYEFDNYGSEVKIIFVKQTEFRGGSVTHKDLSPLGKRLKTEINKRWLAGIMLYGGTSRVQNETKVS